MPQQFTRDELLVLMCVMEESISSGGAGHEHRNTLQNKLSDYFKEDEPFFLDNDIQHNYEAFKSLFPIDSPAFRTLDLPGVRKVVFTLDFNPPNGWDSTKLEVFCVPRMENPDA